MFRNQQRNNPRQQPEPSRSLSHTNSLMKNVLTCLLVLLLLLFEGYAIEATPLIRLRQQEEHQHHHNHHHPEDHQHQEQHHPENNIRDCEHKSLVELIKSSPIILKALGSHIFTHFDDDDDDLRSQQSSEAEVTPLFPSWQSEQNFYAAQKKPSSSSTSSASASASSSLPGSHSTFSDRLNAKQKPPSPPGSRDPTPNSDGILASYSSLSSDALLITLTPDTIYKGASLLKTATNAAVSASSSRSSSSTFGNGYNAAAVDSDSANDGDSLYSSSESMVDG